MENLKKYISKRKELISEMKTMLETIKKMKKLANRNSSKFNFKIGSRGYGVFTTIEYRIYIDHETKVVLDVDIKEENAEENHKKAIVNLEIAIESKEKHIIEVEKLLNQEYLESLKVKRKRLLQIANNAMQELADLYYLFPNEKLYKELLEIEFMDRFYARNY